MPLGLLPLLGVEVLHHLLTALRYGTNHLSEKLIAFSSGGQVEVLFIGIDAELTVHILTE